MLTRALSSSRFQNAVVIIQFQEWGPERKGEKTLRRLDGM